jgi:tellurite resistance protein TerC
LLRLAIFDNQKSTIINEQLDNWHALLLLFWILFNVFALGMLVLDLLVIHRRGRIVRSREALAWSGLWIVLAAGFAALVFFWQGRQVALEFVTGYVLELSLSVDNLFLFLLIFRYFSVPEQNQRSVLFLGVLGAMLMRGVFIFAGVGLIRRFHWVLYVLGALLIYSGIRLAFSGEHRVDPTNNSLVRTIRRLIPVTDDFSGGHFLVRGWKGNPGIYATPLLIVLAVIETTDMLFAVDSIPAVLAITLNAFIVYTSNIFAILGLRSMYFAVSGLMRTFRFLHAGLAVVLILVGVKMIASQYLQISTLVMLAIVAGILGVSVMVSLACPKNVVSRTGS